MFLSNFTSDLGNQTFTLYNKLFYIFKNIKLYIFIYKIIY